MPGRHAGESVGQRGQRATSGGHAEESVGRQFQQATSPTVNYGRRPTPDGMSLQPTLSLCWLPPWPPSPQSTGAPSLRVATSAPRSQPVYCEWMGLSGGGGFFCNLFFWRHFLGDKFLGGRLPSFCFPFFWFFWLTVTWCIVLLFHPLPSVLLGLFVPPVFSISWLRHELWAGVSMYVDTLSTLGPHSSPHPSITMCS
jgi:hypothetical protein